MVWKIPHMNDFMEQEWAQAQIMKPDYNTLATTRLHT